MEQINAKKLLRSLRTRQIEMLNKNAWPKDFETFYKDVLKMVESGQLQRLNVYALFSDLFEDCPEESLEQFFSIFTQIQPQVPLPTEHLHHCTKVVRMITSKLTVTHDLKFRGTLQRFLTQIMPLTHPTGVNLLGKFNETNTTGISTQKEVRESQTSVSDDFAGLSQGDDRNRTSSQQQFSVGEFKAYKNFWSLQKYLNNPFLIFKAEGTLDFEEQNTEIEFEAIEDQAKGDDNKSEASFADGSSPAIQGTEKVVDTLTSLKVSQETYKSSLLHVIAIINKFLERFKSQPLNPQSSNAQIQDKYPKYLSKFSLLNLQLNDSTFRVTFLTQVAIFLQTILTPLSSSPDQVRYFKLKDDEIALVKELQAQVTSLIEVNSESTNTNCLKQSIFETEPQWLKWKANKCLNYEIQSDANILQKLSARRQAKLESKQPQVKPLVQSKELNIHRGAKKIHQSLRAASNKEQASQPSLSKFLVPVLIDLDPDMAIEDEYKHKYNQLFSWRLLRSIAETDLKNFSGDQQPQSDKLGSAAANGTQKSKSQFRFEGNIETQAQILLGNPKKSE